MLDATTEVLKATCAIMIWLPRPLHAQVEEAAAAWKAQYKKGETHPDGCSCVTARTRALLSTMLASHTTKTHLALSDPSALVDLKSLQVLLQEGASDTIAHFQLKKGKGRDAHLCPYEITFVSSGSGSMFRRLVLSAKAIGEEAEGSVQYKAKPYGPRRQAGPLLQAATGRRKGLDASMEDDDDDEE